LRLQIPDIEDELLMLSRLKDGNEPAFARIYD
jgi:hypothetical protein